MEKLTPEIISELKSFFVERYVDNMSTEDLVEYVTMDMDKYVDGQTDDQFLNDARDYWDDGFDDVVEEIREYADCDFKKDRRDDYLESLSEGKDLTPFQEELEVKKFIRDNDDYSSKVDALVDSMGVTDQKVNTIHRRKDLDLL